VTVSIIGAGMAGLLAGAMFRQEATVYEAAKSLPNNHHALLRFRSDDIAQHLNIPFQPVEVVKIVKPWRNKVADAAGYSLKSNGRASLRSIKTAEGKVDQRFIAPPDFIEQLHDHCHDVRFGQAADLEALKVLAEKGPVLSTMPMPALMKLLGYDDKPTFEYRHGMVVRADLYMPSDLCATIYYPDLDIPIIRATLTGELIQVELVDDFNQELWDVSRIMDLVLTDFGLESITYSAELKRQAFAKIVGIDDRARRRFIMHATDEFNIYSIGRYAIWKEGLLLDDVFHDVRKIQAMLRSGDNYHGRLKAC
jgi:hypothetical protein